MTHTRKEIEDRIDELEMDIIFLYRKKQWTRDDWLKDEELHNELTALKRQLAMCCKAVV